MEIKVTRVNVLEQTTEERTDFIAEETALHIYLNKIHYGTILCSPSQLKEMVVGHLLSEGIITSINEIEELQPIKGEKFLLKLKSNIDTETRISLAQRFSRLIVSACGSPDYRPISEITDNLPKLNLNWTIDAKIISQSVKKLNTIAENFRKTGGVHVGALYTTSGKLVTMAEDVGRHNAVDKVIGFGALKGINFENLFLTLSGRLTGDIVLKAARLRIPIIASLSAAISSGLEIARLTQLTIIGFVRGKRMNIYSYPERIILKNSVS